MAIFTSYVSHYQRVCLWRSTIFKAMATCSKHPLPPQRCSTPSSPPGRQQPPPSADHPFALTTNSVPMMMCSSAKVDSRQGHKTACGNGLFPTSGMAEFIAYPRKMTAQSEQLICASLGKA